MAVKKGDRVQVEYIGKLEDGTVFDSTEKQGEPLEFEAGSKQLIPGFDEGVIGMELGEQKTIVIEPADGYGEADPNLVRDIERKNFPADAPLKPNILVEMSLPNGMALPAVIREVGEEFVKLDFNHPLAGKTLTFDIKILNIAS